MEKSKIRYFHLALASCAVQAVVVFGPFLCPPEQEFILKALLILFLLSLFGAIGFGFTSLVRQEPKRLQTFTVIVVTLSIAAFFILRHAYEHDMA